MTPPNKFKIPATQREREALDEKSKNALIEYMADRIQRLEIRCDSLATGNASLSLALGDKAKKRPQKPDDDESQ